MPLKHVIDDSYRLLLHGRDDRLWATRRAPTACSIYNTKYTRNYSEW